MMTDMQTMIESRLKRPLIEQELVYSEMMFPDWSYIELGDLFDTPDFRDQVVKVTLSDGRLVYVMTDENGMLPFPDESQFTGAVLMSEQGNEVTWGLSVDDETTQEAWCRILNDQGIEVYSPGRFPGWEVKPLLHPQTHRLLPNTVVKYRLIDDDEVCVQSDEHGLAPTPPAHDIDRMEVVDAHEVKRTHEQATFIVGIFIVVALFALMYQCH